MTEDANEVHHGHDSSGPPAPGIAAAMREVRAVTGGGGQAAGRVQRGRLGGGPRERETDPGETERA